jgi:hypothetical protein
MKRWQLPAILTFTFVAVPMAFAQSAPCGEKPDCSPDQGIWAQRLHDAWNSSATTSEQRSKMDEIIAANRTSDRTDWPKAASQYFSWRNGEAFDLEKALKPRMASATNGIDYGAMRRAAEQYIRTRLIDPSSAVFNWPYGFAWASWRPLFKKSVQGTMTCGYVNSRNRMGGYGGQSAFVVMMDGTNVTYFDMDDGIGKGVVENGCAKGAKSILPTPQRGMLEPGDNVQQATASSRSVADELKKLAALRDSGVLSAAEFQTQKEKLLAQ